MSFDCTRRAIDAFQRVSDPGDKVLIGAVVALSALGATAGWIGATALGMAAASGAAMGAAGAITTNNVVVSSVGLAASSAVASGSASAAGQLISRGSVDPTTVAVTAGVGMMTGGVAAVPGIATTIPRAMGLGAASNMTTYSLNELAHGATPNAGSLVANGVIGAVGGGIGGTIVPVKHKYYLEGVFERVQFRNNNFNAGTGGRTFAGVLTTNIDWQKLR
jgi:hypothetical protein